VKAHALIFELLTQRRLLERQQISIPALFIGATKDAFLKPETWKGMEKYLPNLTSKTVEASHWALTQKPEEVNGFIRNWLEAQNLGLKSSL
jgi:pimeloyl-ACP methyl ester carboxylesterase